MFRWLVRVLLLRILPRRLIPVLAAWDVVQFARRTSRDLRRRGAGPVPRSRTAERLGGRAAPVHDGPDALQGGKAGARARGDAAPVWVPPVRPRAGIGRATRPGPGWRREFEEAWSRSEEDADPS